MATYFNLEILNVQNKNGDSVNLDLTAYTNKEAFVSDLAEALNCEEDELNTENSTYYAQEDFLIKLVGIDDSKEDLLSEITDDVFQNISDIENSDISLDVIEAAIGVLSSSDSCDTILKHAKENYIGTFSSDSKFSEYYCEHYEELEIPSILQGCIDWDRVWNSSLKYDHTEHNGHYFRD